MASSKEGDIVLDPFSGTFTTSAVAMKLNRKSISIELDEDYFNNGLKRLTKIHKDIKNSNSQLNLEVYNGKQESLILEQNY